MYEDLVKSLKICGTPALINEKCIAFHDGCCEAEPVCMYELMRKAANAIEELSNAGSIYGKAWTLGYDAGRDEHSPHWIPATERLPEEAYACLAIVWDDNSYTGNTFLNYYPEFVGYGGGSWNDYNGDEIPFEVVYWMKLPQIPEPPKEEH